MLNYCVLVSTWSKNTNTSHNLHPKGQIMQLDWSLPKEETRTLKGFLIEGPVELSLK